MASLIKNDEVHHLKRTRWVMIMGLTLMVLLDTFAITVEARPLNNKKPTIAINHNYYGDNRQRKAGTETITTKTMTAIRGGDTSKKLANLKERSLPAILMLGGLFLCLKYLNDNGWIVLILLIQMGLYHEGTNVVKWSSTFIGKFSPLANNKLSRWWWFFAYSLAINGPRVFGGDRLPWASPSLSRFVAYSMVLSGIMGVIAKLNLDKSFSYDFLVSLRELSSYHMAIVFLVLPSSFWIATIQDYGINWVLYSSLLVIINDTMAYVFGMLMGKHPILEYISPKKTWEGFWGAFIFTNILSPMVWQTMNMPDTYNIRVHGRTIAMFCSLLAPFGGFLASLVKRAYGKKDYSNLIAGHGGFVDRLDCQIITAPFVYLYLNHFLKQ